MHGLVTIKNLPIQQQDHDNKKPTQHSKQSHHYTWKQLRRSYHELIHWYVAYSQEAVVINSERRKDPLCLRHG